MLNRAVALAVLTLAMSSCLSMTAVNGNVTDKRASNLNEAYNLQQAIRNIAFVPLQTRLTLQNPEALNQDSFVLTGNYSALVTKPTAQIFHGQKVYSKDYTIKQWVNGDIFRQRDGKNFYTIDGYRFIGSKSMTLNTETVLTKLYDVPKMSNPDSKGKMGKGYMELMLSRQDNQIGVAKVAVNWSLTKVDDQKAQFCEISTAYYDVKQFGADTSDSTSDCYLINKQGDILGFESDMTISPRNGIPELRFITE